MAKPEYPLLLVVDDDEAGRYSKSQVLRRAGYDVLEAVSGEDALRLVAERQPRLVLLDVKLPDIDGLEVCRRIKTNPTTASVVVLQTSATYVTEEDNIRALEGGADGCLNEPVEPTVLVATIRALLRARQAEDALREALSREQAARTAAESANRMKDEFLATLSHELRSPLGAILTWITLLRTGDLDHPRTERALEAIERSTRMQVRLVEDLLDVSRITSGKLNLDVGLVNVAALVEAAVESIRKDADGKGIGVERVLDSEVRVSGDAARLQQVVWNLLSNAVKFTPRGGRVSVELAAHEGEALITVRDTGEGIAPAFLPHVFERFRQADSSSTRKGAGLGLGLAIVHHLVSQHGGTVHASSEGVGRGTTISVRLPLAAAWTRAAMPEWTPARETGAPRLMPLDGVAVLLVDDDADAREALSAVLEQCGATVRITDSVAAALAALGESVPEVIISDIAMPGADGYALIEQLKRLDGSGSQVPALAVTAYAGAEDRRRALAAGFQAWLPKPVDAVALVAAVARLVRRPPS
jgi:signal transduction histidine kinase